MFPVPRGFLTAVRITGRSGLPSLPIVRLTNVLVARVSIAQSRSGHELDGWVACGTDSAQHWAGRLVTAASLSLECEVGM